MQNWIAACWSKFFSGNNYYTKVQAIITQNVAVLRPVNRLSWNLVFWVKRDHITTSQRFENITLEVSIFKHHRIIHKIHYVSWQSCFDDIFGRCHCQEILIQIVRILNLNFTCLGSDSCEILTFFYLWHFVVTILTPEHNTEENVTETIIFLPSEFCSVFSIWVNSIAKC